MNVAQIRQAFEDVFDQALLFHGFAAHMRDYDLYLYAAADPRTGLRPDHLRYRFVNCVRASVASSVARDVWARSLDDTFTDNVEWLAAGSPEGYVWGVRWQMLYPGLALLPPTPETREWAAQLGVPFYEAVVETNAHTISLVFSDLRVDKLAAGATPFVVEDDEPGAKVPPE